jgi:hypothetical protein
LVHEQLHYEIAAVLARDLALALRQLRGATTADLQAKLNNTFKEYGKEGLQSSINDLYDTETDHGRDPTKQAKWENLVRKAKQSSSTPLRSLVGM